MRVITYFILFLLLIVFFFLSILLSMTFLHISNDSPTLDLLEVGDLLPDNDGSFLRRFHPKLNRVRNLDLSTLKRTKSCRFFCRPAILNHESGMGSSIRDPDPNVKIMINHCLSCLRRKGYMEKINDVRLRDRERFATPLNKMTSTVAPLVKKRSLPRHGAFGGWISDALDTVERKSAPEKGLNIQGRKLLGKPGLKNKFEVKKRPIFVGNQMDDSYENNYEDKTEDESIPDFEKVEENTRKLISNILFGALIFFAVFFILIYPITNFIEMCAEDCSGNCSMVRYMLCCRNPKYVLVKKKCEEENLYIPNYRKYQKLMKKCKIVAVETESSIYTEENISEMASVETVSSTTSTAYTESSDSTNFDSKSSTSS